MTGHLDFVGPALKTYSVYTDPRHEPIGVAETYRYDHAGRLVATRLQLPGEAGAAQLDSLHYNEVSQVVRKQLSPGTALAQDYAYYSRSWLWSRALTGWFGIVSK